MGSSSPLHTNQPPAQYSEQAGSSKKIDKGALGLLILVITSPKHRIMVGMGTSPSTQHRWKVGMAAACEEQNKLGLTPCGLGIVVVAHCSMKDDIFRYRYM